MNSWKCIVSDKKGKIFTILKTGNNENDVIRSFYGSNLTLLQITKDLNSDIQFSKKKAQKAVLDFTQMMDLLLDSGLSIKDSLEVTALIGNKKSTGRLAQMLLDDINKGFSFATAINRMKNVFSQVYCGIISVGDRIGSVEKIFPRLSQYLENQKKIHDKVTGALIYPIMVLCITFIGAISLVVFVMPKLQTLFEDFGGEAAIQLQQNIDNLQKSCLVLFTVIFLIILLFIFISIFSRKNSSFKRKIDYFFLKIPLIGHYISTWQTMNFSFAMETLTAGGITVESAISESLSVISNEAYKYALQEVINDLIKGISLSNAFSKHSEFPTYMSQWLIVGERSGKTERVFAQIRTYFQNETNLFSEKIMTIIEPSLILLVGIILLSIIGSIIVPLFSLYGSII